MYCVVSLKNDGAEMGEEGESFLSIDLDRLTGLIGPKLLWREKEKKVKAQALQVLKSHPPG